MHCRVAHCLSILCGLEYHVFCAIPLYRYVQHHFPCCWQAAHTHARTVWWVAMGGTMLLQTECTITDMHEPPFPSTRHKRPILHSGPLKTAVPKNPKNCGSTPTPLLGQACACAREGYVTPKPAIATLFMAGNHSKTDSIGLQYQSECRCEQEEPSQTGPSPSFPLQSAHNHAVVGLTAFLSRAQRMQHIADLCPCFSQSQIPGGSRWVSQSSGVMSWAKRPWCWLPHRPYMTQVRGAGYPPKGLSATCVPKRQLAQSAERKRLVDAYKTRGACLSVANRETRRCQWVEH